MGSIFRCLLTYQHQGPVPVSTLVFTLVLAPGQAPGCVNREALPTLALETSAGTDVAQQMCVCSHYTACVLLQELPAPSLLFVTPWGALAAWGLKQAPWFAVSRTAQFLRRWRSCHDWLIHSLLFWKLEKFLLKLTPYNRIFDLNNLLILCLINNWWLTAHSIQWLLTPHLHVKLIFHMVGLIT